MRHSSLQQKEVRAYIFLTTLVICGLAGSLITATKVIHFVVDFPFSNIIFSLFTYPIVDCICELWGKKAARQTLWLGLTSQALIASIIQLSIVTPHATYWKLQPAYHTVLSTGILVITASLLAFFISQLLDIFVYQRIKELSRGQWLWLRSNVSTFLGQIIDSWIFIMIIFFNSDKKYTIFLGSVSVKVILSLLMTPIIYLIVMGTNHYLRLGFVVNPEKQLAKSSFKDQFTPLTTK